MNKANTAKPAVKKAEKAGVKKKKLNEIKYQESPLVRALKLSSEEALAMAIRDLIKRDELN